MSQTRFLTIVFSLLLVFPLVGAALAQPGGTSSPSPPRGVPCGPDHQILYKRAVTLLDNAEKKLNARFTAEAKSMAKEAKSLFAILQKECGQDQKERLLTPKEEQQEAINQKLTADEQAQADRLVKSAEDKFKKATLLGNTQPEMYTRLMREAKAENKQAEIRSIKAMIYALRTDQMLFSFLAK
jgi:predicted lactoylglutathione lyase